MTALDALLTGLGNGGTFVLIVLLAICLAVFAESVGYACVLLASHWYRAAQNANDEKALARVVK